MTCSTHVSLKRCHSPLTLMIVDDDARLRARLVRLCSEQIAAVTIFEASSGVEAIELAKLHRCDVAVMDVQMSGMNGLAALRALKQLNVNTPMPTVIILSGLSREPYEAEALKRGAFAFLSKDRAAQELVALIVDAADRGNRSNGGRDD